MDFSKWIVPRYHPARPQEIIQYYDRRTARFVSKETGLRARAAIKYWNLVRNIRARNPGMTTAEVRSNISIGIKITETVGYEEAEKLYLDLLYPE